MHGKAPSRTLLTCLIPLLLLAGSAMSQDNGPDFDIDEVLRELESRSASHPEFSAWPAPSDTKSIAKMSSASGMVVVDADRSLLVREKALLTGLSFQDVMAALAVDPDTRFTGAPDQIGLGASLFRQWMSTADLTETPNAEGLVCKDNVLMNGMNKPYTCRVGFSRLAGEIGNFGNHVAGGKFLEPRAAVNRFDIGRFNETAKESCGEFRLIFQLAPVHSEAEEASFAFEPSIAKTPGRPGKCTAIVRFWHNLGENGLSQEVVAARLRAFFLEGLTLDSQGRIVETGYNPDKHYRIERAINRRNFGTGPDREFGQIRTNTFSEMLSWSDTGKKWMLREYRVAYVASKTLILPSTTKSSFHLDLFRANGSISDPVKQRFMTLLKESSGEAFLLNKSLAQMRLHPDRLGASTAVDFYPYETISDDYQTYSYWGVLVSPSGDPNIKDRLLQINELLYDRPNSELSDTQKRGAANRLMALGCSGCHHHVKSGVPVGSFDAEGNEICWEGGTNFKHIRTGGDPEKYEVSKYLKEIALPFRETRMKQVVSGLYGDW